MVQLGFNLCSLKVLTLLNSATTCVQYAFFLLSAKEQQGMVDFKGVQTEMTLPSPHDPEGISVSVYKPESCGANPPILVYFHGGGLVSGSRYNVATPLKIIAMESGAIVVNADYRLLPNEESPCAPFEDGVTVTRWVMSHRTEVGGTEGSRVGVGGDSSGGHITACVTNAVLGLDFQVLIYPVVDTTLSQDSFKEFARIPLLNTRSMRWFFANSMDRIPNHKTDPRYNPMARTNTKLSPPTLIVLAEIDVLVGSGLDYAQKLRTAGVPVKCEVVKGAAHAIFTSRTVTKKTSAEAYGHIVRFLSKL